MTIIGIDPGKKGAIAVIRPNTVTLYDTPLLDGDYYINYMADILQSYARDNLQIFIEKVHAMPGQGTVSMFNFGKGYGIWLGIICAMKLPYTLVPPQTWKKVMMEGIKDKDASRTRAIQLFPALSLQLCRKKDVGKADALLIAEYGRRKLMK